MQTETESKLPPHEAFASSTSSKRKKKRKKSVSALSNYSSDDGDGDTILQSKLSLKKQLSLKKSCKQTPWYDTNELIETGRALLLSLKLFPTHRQQQHQHTATPEGLTPDEHTQLQLAFRRVAVWRGHSARGRLSHAVDITAGLAGLLLSDAERTCHSTTGNNPYQLRNSYSTLLLRSVNGLADTYRHQRKSSLLSVSHCCALAGLPLWIVDIRHDASHNDLPSLGLCRIGAIESLRFWKTRYWDTLEDKVWGKKSEIGTLADAAKSDEVGICTYALDCLVRYQQAALLEAKEKKSSKRNQEETKKDIKPQMKQDHSPGIADHETDDILLLPDEPKRVAARQKSDAQTADSNNPFAILDGDKKPKKKKPKKNSEQKNDLDVATHESKPAVLNDDDTTKAALNNSQVSSRDCAAEFVREIPMDIAISEVLKFLVWGIGHDDLKIRQGPAILTGQAVLSLTQDIDDSFNKLRAIYDPLLIAITSAYPGFLAALLVHLIDSILCLDCERRSQESQVANESDQYLQKITRNIQDMSMWVHYLFSREFHMHFNRAAAIYVEEAKSVQVTSQTGEKREFQSHPIDLKKKGRNNWTQQQLNFMQSHLPYTTFQSLGVPMNSICDRIISHREKYSGEIGSVVGKLLHLFLDILEENRIAFMGLAVQKGTDANVNDDVCVAAYKADQEGVISDADKSAAEASTDATAASKDMSLEDIEAFLSNATKTEDKCTDEGTNDLSNVQAKRKTQSSSVFDAPEIKPWTLCKSWDSCAIGSLPGYPA